MKFLDTSDTKIAVLSDRCKDNPGNCTSNMSVRNVKCFKPDFEFFIFHDVNSVHES